MYTGNAFIAITINVGHEPALIGSKVSLGDGLGPTVGTFTVLHDCIIGQSVQTRHNLREYTGVHDRIGSGQS